MSAPGLRHVKWRKGCGKRVPLTKAGRPNAKGAGRGSFAVASCFLGTAWEAVSPRGAQELVPPQPAHGLRKADSRESGGRVAGLGSEDKLQRHRRGAVWAPWGLWPLLPTVSPVPPLPSGGGMEGLAPSPFPSPPSLPLL